MSIRVGPGTRITLVYTLKSRSSSGRSDVLEDRTPENPFIFEYGQGKTLPAIEAVIKGKTEGFEAALGVAAKEAYGEFDDELVAQVSLSTFPTPNEVSVGMKYSTKGPLGEEITVRVVEIDDENATVDGNHPLAGVDIEIDLKIIEIEAVATSGDERADAPSLHPLFAGDDKGETTDVFGPVTEDDGGTDDDDESSDDGDTSGGSTGEDDAGGGQLLH